MVKWLGMLGYDGEGHESESQHGSTPDWKSLFVNPALKMGTFLKSGKDKAGKGDGWVPPFICYAQDTVGF